MRLLLSVILCLGVFSLYAQKQEEELVQKTIEAFFEGFHKQDSTMMQQTIGDNPILQTIGKDKAGHLVVKNQGFDKLIGSIVSIPDSVNFQEKILSYSIQVDGAMANAWTPYEFWLNGSFHHCGVNSFQLFNNGDAWKIIYLIDTRRKEDCKE
jgi:hypothetical protein